MASPSSLPEAMNALVLHSTTSPPTLSRIPVPQPEIGSAIVRVLATSVISYTRDIANGKRAYPFPKPLVVGFSAIARIAAVGPDATKLKAGDLVYVDSTTRSRDNPSDVYLAGCHQGYTAGSQKLMTDMYRDWTSAEYCRAPLESITLLDERRLTADPASGGLGYSVDELAFLPMLLVPYGGLADIELKAGQTVIIAPATGPFGGAAVLVALAMGARVIAMGRNRDSLAELKRRVPIPERVETVAITGDMQADCTELKKHDQIDAFFDIGPPEAHASTHIKSSILALRHGARISLMGGYREDVPIPHVIIMHYNMRLYGKWMYERGDIADLVRMIENGMLKLGKAGGISMVGGYPLDQWREAWDMAAENTRLGEYVVLKP